MSAPQLQNNNHATHVMGSTRTNVDESNNNYKVKEFTVFCMAVKITYNVISFIPRKTRVGIKLIYNKAQKLIHDRKVRAMLDKNADYLEKARVVSSSTVPDTLQRANDSKGKDLSTSRVLETNPSCMEKIIEEEDQETTVIKSAKMKEDLRWQYGKLESEYRKLEHEERELGGEIDMLSDKLFFMDACGDNTGLKYKELMKTFKVKQEKMKVLKAEMVSKEKALANAHKACNRHIGS